MSSFQAPKGQSPRRLDGPGIFDNIFGFGPNDRTLAIFVDFPHGEIQDTASARWLRKTAAGWCQDFRRGRNRGSPTAKLLIYPATGDDGAPLPTEVAVWTGHHLPEHLDRFAVWPQKVKTVEALRRCNCAVFATRFSATHELRHLVTKHRLPVRIATLPGFTPEMMPVFRADYAEAARRTMVLKDLLDKTVAADIKFVVDGQTEYVLHVDLRHRELPEYECLASTGRLLRPGQVANGIPAEAYVAPYDGDDSQTAGWLPIQINHDPELVLYCFQGNQVVEVVGASHWAKVERELIGEDPSRGHLGELGLGVVNDMGVDIEGEVPDTNKVMLLLEKLGFHIAFGDGGRVRSSIHHDRVYLEKYMPRIRLALVTLIMGDGSPFTLMVNNHYAPGLFG